MEFALIKNGSKSFYATPIFARVNPWSTEDRSKRNMRYLVFDESAMNLHWINSISTEVKTDNTGALYRPNAKLIRDAHLLDEFPWKLSDDIANGVHFNSVLGEVFDNFSVKNDEDYESLQELTSAISADVLKKCHKIVAGNPFPEWHDISAPEDMQNLFFTTSNLSFSSFTDVSISEERISVKICSILSDWTLEIVFENTPKASKSVLKNPMAKWSEFWFVFDRDTMYLLNNENIDSVDDIKSSTKYFCGNKVTYKFVPYY